MRTNGILKSASNLRNLIKVLAVYLNKSSIFDYPKHVCQVKTDQPTAQAKLRFCWTYLSGGTFSHVATHIIVSIKPSEGNDVCEQRKCRLSVESTTACRYLRLISNIWAELQRCKTSLWTCAPIEDSDQYAHNLIRIFTGHIADNQGCNVSSCGQRRLMKLTAELNRHWTNMFDDTLSNVAVRIKKTQMRMGYRAVRPMICDLLSGTEL